MAPPKKLKRFPALVRRTMREAGAAATCAAMQLDDGPVQVALFLNMGLARVQGERKLLQRWNRALALGMETDVVNTSSGAVVVLRPQIRLGEGETLAFAILLTPGVGKTDSKSLKLLESQARLSWFFGDADFNVMRSQSHPLQPDQHAEFKRLRRNAFEHDASMHMTARYDAIAAHAKALQHYASHKITPAGKPLS
jgi:hypothetical protein